MSKKIIAVAVLMIVVTVLFAACKKDEYKVVDTVQVGTTTVDIYEDKDGQEYVTNVDGDMVPIKPDEDGFIDIEAHLTETTTKKGDTTTSTTKPADDTTTTTEKPADDTTTTEKPADDTTTTTETTTKTQVEIGGSGKQDVISWDDIINA